MKNKDKWKPSKYIYKNGKLIASRDPKIVNVGSRLFADLIAGAYSVNIEKHAKGKLLDLGCGKVPLYAVYKRFITENICVDWASTLHKNEYLDYEIDIVERLPFRDNEFDTIILSDVLEHIPEPEHLWKEMSRILSINGKIIISVPFYYWLHEQPYDYYRYTEYALKRFAEKSRLTLINIESIGGAPEVIADIFAKNIIFFPKIGGLLSVATQYLTHLFIITKFGKKMSNFTSKKFPLGYFLIAEKRA